jgi:hypothetical protein
MLTVLLGCTGVCFVRFRESEIYQQSSCIQNYLERVINRKNEIAPGC